jgi:hypothetical protein
VGFVVRKVALTQIAPSTSVALRIIRSINYSTIIIMYHPRLASALMDSVPLQPPKNTNAPLFLQAIAGAAGLTFSTPFIVSLLFSYYVPCTLV